VNAIKHARKLLEADPTSEAAKTFAHLVLALESEGDFSLTRLYDLDIQNFDLAMKILAEWRIDRYYAGKAKLFDLSHQINVLSMS